MPYVVEAPPVVSVPVLGGSEFPVRRIFCVGRNYAAHVREMGGDPDREAPFFFTKPADAIVLDGATLPYPPQTADFHWEVELVLAVGVGGADIAVEQAASHLFGYAVGLDLTRRDLQIEAKRSGRPWDMSKAFDHSAPCGMIAPAQQSGDLENAAIHLAVNGETRQRSDLSCMVWSVAEIVASLSRFVTLQPGDLIYTGTPEGVGAIHPGDRLSACVDGLPALEIHVACPAPTAKVPRIRTWTM